MISEGLISSFYNFKGNSFYSDTNFLALVIQNFALVCFFLYKKFNDSAGFFGSDKITSGTYCYILSVAAGGYN